MTKLSCGCTPDASGFGYCSECDKQLKKKIWKDMSEGRKNFDRYIAPEQSEYLDLLIGPDPVQGCSCHINPPCSYCISKSEA